MKQRYPMTGFNSDRLALINECEYVSSLFKSDYDITITGSMVRVKVGPIEVYGRGFKQVRMLLIGETVDFLQGVA